MSLAYTRRDLASLYERLAPQYDRLHRRWLRHAGGEAQVALEASVRALATSNTNLLDAGCGTGHFARALLAEGHSPDRITLLDPSSAMLSRCADLPVRRIKGRLEALPFHDGEFDIVTCAWALETVSQPESALGELSRIVRPGGVLCLAFCAQGPAGAASAWLMRQAILWRGTGRFLSREKVATILRQSGEFEVRMVPNSGPAAALLARRQMASGRPVKVAA
ncbi:MAG: methyltransferase domain-containing protein [Pseudomonadota bacterium]